VDEKAREGQDREKEKERGGEVIRKRLGKRVLKKK